MVSLLWIQIILYILYLMSRGMSKRDALREASSRFSVSVGDILKHLR